jgi:hypothetical protein
MTSRFSTPYKTRKAFLKKDEENAVEADENKEERYASVK